MESRLNDLTTMVFTERRSGTLTQGRFEALREEALTEIEHFCAGLPEQDRDTVRIQVIADFDANRPQ